jgi:chemotaxis signal transduction protein
MSVPVTASSAKPPANTATSIKLIAFTIGKLNLAVRIDQVQKVVNLPTVHGSGLNPVGLTQVGDQEITVINLYQRLFRTEAAQSPVSHTFLVLVRTAAGEVLGIPVSETPLLLEVPMNLIRILPDSYRRADTLEIASHIMVVPEGESTRTLFLLDVAMLNKVSLLT